MDRWKSRDRTSQRREEKKQEDQRRKKIQAREKVKTLCFSNVLWFRRVEKFHFAGSVAELFRFDIFNLHFCRKSRRFAAFLPHHVFQHAGKSVSFSSQSDR